MKTVAITFAELNKLDNDVHKGIFLLKRLKAAGIPIVGVLYPVTVSRGTLAVTGEPMFDEALTYRWTE